MHRTPAAFQKDLDLLYSNGYQPINLSEAITGRINIPAGKKPVVLTFDDSRKSQFILTETATEQQIDPNCAVGILEDFVKTHKDWSIGGIKGMFFVLPTSPSNMDVFGQAGLGEKKLEYLQNAGFEIGNHTYLHKSLRFMNASQIQEALGKGNNAILREYPRAKLSIFAVPMGQYPHDKKLWPLLKTGKYQGTTYNHIAVMDAAWRPMYSPFTKKFNAVRLERITPEDINFGLAYWIKQLDKTQSAYVSDGNPQYVTYPAAKAALADPNRIKKLGLTPNVYGGANDPAGDSKKPITMGVKVSPLVTKPIIPQKPIHLVTP